MPSFYHGASTSGLTAPVGVGLTGYDNVANFCKKDYKNIDLSLRLGAGEA